MLFFSFLLPLYYQPRGTALQSLDNPSMDAKSRNYAILMLTFSAWPGFAGSAENIYFTLEGDAQVPILRARLSESNESFDADVNLAERIGNDNGNLSFGKLFPSAIYGAISAALNSTDQLRSLRTRLLSHSFASRQLFTQSTST